MTASVKALPRLCGDFGLRSVSVDCRCAVPVPKPLPRLLVHDKRDAKLRRRQLARAEASSRGAAAGQPM